MLLGSIGEKLYDSEDEEEDEDEEEEVYETEDSCFTDASSMGNSKDVCRLSMFYSGGG